MASNDLVVLWDYNDFSRVYNLTLSITVNSEIHLNLITFDIFDFQLRKYETLIFNTNQTTEVGI